LRKILVMTAVVVAILTSLPIGGLVAVAAEPTTTAAVSQTLVDLKPIIDTAIGLAATVLLTMGSFAARWLLTKLRLDADAQVRGYLDAAISNAVAYGAAQAAAFADPRSKVDLRSEAIASAANYLVARVPDALRHFGLDEADVKHLLEARLAGHEQAAAIATAA
jgi:hypothetical protein